MNAKKYCFYKVGQSLGPSAKEALEELYSLFDDRVYLWVADAFDPEVGGFYYSTRSKPIDLYLPDIESTRQALTFISNSGLADVSGGRYSDFLPANIKEKIVEYTKSLQAPEGYFYHPQWGKVIKPSRKGRDLMWARRILKDFGAEPPYPYATEQMKSGNTPDSVPEYIKDKKLLWEYMESLGLNEDSYVKGQQLSSQTEMIIAAGNADVQIKFLRERQFADNGLWERGVAFNGVSGLLKLSSAYNILKAPILNIERTLESAIAVAVSEEAPTSITGIYNPPNAISNLINNLRLTGRDELIPKFKARIAESAADIITALTRRLSPYKFDADGSFSYFTYRSGHVSQGCPVVPKGERCGDMNAILLALGCLTSIYEIIDLPRIPVYGSEDSARFLEALLAAKPAIKTEQPPEWDSALIASKKFV